MAEPRVKQIQLLLDVFCAQHPPVTAALVIHAEGLVMHACVHDAAVEQAVAARSIAWLQAAEKLQQQVQGGRWTRLQLQGTHGQMLLLPCTDAVCLALLQRDSALSGRIAYHARLLAAAVTEHLRGEHSV
ncbi:MAG: roadblock/LC7 domain-containing protein [Polyangiales bacterium]